VLRIIFQFVGYVGTYQPPVIRWTIDAKSDWVRADTPATELGYSSPFKLPELYGIIAKASQKTTGRFAYFPTTT
jgi:hypothetical protein